MKKIYLIFSSITATVVVNAQLYINEYLAVNNSQAAVVDTNEFGKREDWFEIYNAGSAPVNLAGYKVADAGNKFYIIPSGFAFTTIPAKGFVRIWADDTTTLPGFKQIHVPFKLSSSGDKLVLRNSSDETLDSISFGAQQANVSQGRCPDGSATFESFTKPSPGAANCPVSSVSSLDEQVYMMIYPNPANEKFTIRINSPALIKIYSADGVCVKESSINQEWTLETSEFIRGIYFIQVIREHDITVQKLLIQ
ncbi:MAG: lamin tail domain-containing protein [Chitinophagales bacterium]|nr:lamin tail domain-containing protein [Chitinophagales bacterium]MDW8272780.1 lamin tail domain-containing protein [Chitinophagales bacterium]